MLGIPDEDKRSKGLKRKKKGVIFNEEEEIINPEDIDPSIGRFRNLVQTTVIPSSNNKVLIFIANFFLLLVLTHILLFQRPKMDSGLVPSHPAVKHYIARTSVSLYDDLPPDSYGSVSTPFFTTLSSKLDLPLPNPAPDIEPAEEPVLHPLQISHQIPPPPPMDISDEPKKKKYAKEAWPGKKTGAPNLLI